MDSADEFHNFIAASGEQLFDMEKYPFGTHRNENVDTFCATQNTSTFGEVLGSIIIVGTQISYIPQHVNIIRSRSSVGISPWWILLCHLSAWSNIVSAFLTEWDLFICCQISSFWKCNAILLSLYQLLVGWTNLFLLHLLLLFFFESDPGTDIIQARRSRYVVVAFWVVMITYMMLTAFSGFVLIFSSPKIIGGAPQHFAFALGIFSTISTVCMYLPQIYKTWRLRDRGALSFFMLLLQCPGAFMTCAFQMSYKASFTIWLPYMATGIQQAILIYMIVYFWMRARLKRKSEEQQSLLRPDAISTIETMNTY